MKKSWGLTLPWSGLPSQAPSIPTHHVCVSTLPSRSCKPASLQWPLESLRIPPGNKPPGAQGACARVRVTVSFQAAVGRGVRGACAALSVEGGAWSAESAGVLGACAAGCAERGAWPAVHLSWPLRSKGVGSSRPAKAGAVVPQLHKVPKLLGKCSDAAAAAGCGFLAPVWGQTELGKLV